MMSFKATVRRSGDVAIVDLAGRLTLGDGSGMLRSSIKDLTAQGSKKILVNLKEVSYIDSSGLGEMISSYATVTNAGGQIKLLGSQDRVRDLLTITKLYSVFEDFSNEAQAVASFNVSDAARV
jgi:anti-sigma B factor antagonist